MIIYKWTIFHSYVKSPQGLLIRFNRSIGPRFWVAMAIFSIH